MPFLAVQPNQPATLQPLILSGKSGILARFILSLGSTAEDGWKISGEQVAEAATGIPGSTLLWQAPPDAPQKVSSICGRSMFNETEVLIHMEAPHREGTTTQTNYSEALRLCGGYSTPNATWTWTSPKMAIGAVQVCPA